MSFPCQCSVFSSVPSFCQCRVFPIFPELLLLFCSGPRPSAFCAKVECGAFLWWWGFWVIKSLSISPGKLFHNGQMPVHLLCSKYVGCLPWYYIIPTALSQFVPVSLSERQWLIGATESGGVSSGSSRCCGHGPGQRPGLAVA
jgi:hypothetical protein